MIALLIGCDLIQTIQAAFGCPNLSHVLCKIKILLQGIIWLTRQSRPIFVFRRPQLMARSIPGISASCPPIITKTLTQNLVDMKMRSISAQSAGFPLFLSCFVLMIAGCSKPRTNTETNSSDAQTTESAENAAANADGWRPLFNGKDLTGWTPKIRFSKLGEDPLKTFRVEDGILSVNYDQYEDKFKARFGHLFYNTPFSNYDLRVEYRFVGQQLSDGAGWARMNSGLMLHGQDPSQMTLDQTFPASIEVQFKGSDPAGKSEPTLRCCTPGTNVVRDGKLFTQHCFDSTGPKVPVGEWITVLIEVRGSKVIRHKVGDEVVLEYQQPQLDERIPEVMNGLKVSEEIVQDWYEGKTKPEDYQLSSGTISLQSESHPIEFRRVEIRELE